MKRYLYTITTDLSLCYLDHLVIPKVSFLYFFLTTLALGDIFLYMMNMITTPFVYNNYEIIYSYFVVLHIYIKP